MAAYGPHPVLRTTAQLPACQAGRGGGAGMERRKLSGVSVSSAGGLTSFVEQLLLQSDNSFDKNERSKRLRVI